jgi:hypothetical protein
MENAVHALGHELHTSIRAPHGERDLRHTGANETYGEHEASPSFSQFAPLSTSYNLLYGLG